MCHLVWLHSLFWLNPLLTEIAGKWFLSSLFYTFVDQWIICGLSFMYQWIICGLSFMYQWIICGPSPVDQWIICGLSLMYQWIIYGPSPVNQWIICGLSLMYQWFICGPSPVNQWIICGSSLMYQRIICGHSLMYQWIICGSSLMNHMWIVTCVLMIHMWTFTHIWINHVDCNSFINESYVDCHSCINESYVDLHLCITESLDVPSCVTTSLVLKWISSDKSQQNDFSLVCSTLLDQRIICEPSLMYQPIIRCVILCDFIPCFEVNLFWQRSQENGFSPVCWNSCRWTKDGALNIFGQKRHWYGFFFSLLTWSSEEK